MVAVRKPSHSLPARYNVIKHLLILLASARQCFFTRHAIPMDWAYLLHRAMLDRLAVRKVLSSRCRSCCKRTARALAKVAQSDRAFLHLGLSVSQARGFSIWGVGLSLLVATWFGFAWIWRGFKASEKTLRRLA